MPVLVSQVLPQPPQLALSLSAMLVHLPLLQEV
jgi:hypothetical protein